MTVLIVDGDSFGQALTRDACNAIRFGDVLIADDPVQAAKLLTSRKIDIVITEWSFSPIGGDRLVRGIRTGAGSRDPFMPIIVLTAGSDAATVAAARDAGASDVLARPILLDNLFSRMTYTLGIPRPFARSATFFGPDRRRQSRPYKMPDRRQDSATGAPLAPSRSNADLAKRVDRAGGLSVDEMNAAGKAVIAAQRDQYREICDADLAELFDLIRDYKDNLAAGFPLIKPIHAKAKKIESLGMTFGYPVLSEASSLLGQLLWNVPETKVSSPLIIQGIETHAIVMSMIVKQDIRDDDPELRDELIGGLAALVEKAGTLV